MRALVSRFTLVVVEKLDENMMIFAMKTNSEGRSVKRKVVHNWMG